MARVSPPPLCGTVLRFASPLASEALFTGQWQNRRTELDSFKPYLHQR